MSARDTADRLKGDVQYLRDLQYLSQGGDVTIRGPSLTALLANLTQTLIEVQALTAVSPAEFDRVVAQIRERAAQAQAGLNTQAQAAADKEATLNKPLAGDEADPTKAETQP